MFVYISYPTIKKRLPPRPIGRTSRPRLRDTYTRPYTHCSVCYCRRRGRETVARNRPIGREVVKRKRKLEILIIVYRREHTCPRPRGARWEVSIARRDVLPTASDRRGPGKYHGRWLSRANTRTQAPPVIYVVRTRARPPHNGS